MSNWTLTHGDCVEGVAALADDSVDYCVFSPPFASLYTYSASERDMGNCNSHAQFFEHYSYLVRELVRVIKPGRLCSVHCMTMPTSKTKDGFIGLYDFGGDIVRAHEAAGFIFHSEVCIFKDPVVQMQRTKALGLLHKQIIKDSAMSRMGLLDKVLTFRVPGENQQPIRHARPRAEGLFVDVDLAPERTVDQGGDVFPVELWQKYASPVWLDIDPSDTLQHRSAREHEDERHICPLQLEVIRRCLILWSNPGDLVLSPFTGIGSEGYVALQNGRRFVGFELKASYYKQARANLEAACDNRQRELFG